MTGSDRSKLPVIFAVISSCLGSLGVTAPCLAQDGDATVSTPLPPEVLPGGGKAPRGTIQPQRWTEDWSGSTAPLKRIPLGRDGATLSLGAEARVYYTEWDHASLRLRPNDANAPTLYRLRLSADLQASPYIRAYMELGDNRETGESFPTGPNSGELDLYQGFADLTVPVGHRGRLTVRPGRFEMPLGSGKVVGLREGLNMRFTYQGVQATYILPGTITVHAFDVRPVAIKPGTFDDGANRNVAFRGLYVTAPKRIGGLNLDLYAYEVERTRALVAGLTDIDARRSWGVRLWVRHREWDVDAEAIRQTGTFAGQDIEAYAFMFEGGYSPAGVRFSPRVGLRTNLFSGDGATDDRTAGTYVAPFPRLPLFSEAGFFNLSNLIDVFPSLTFKPVRSLTVMAGPAFLWRQNAADGIYIGSTGARFAPYAGERYIGRAINLEVTWQVNPHLQFRLYDSAFHASNGLKAAGGGNANYFGLQANAKY